MGQGRANEVAPTIIEKGTFETVVGRPSALTETDQYCSVCIPALDYAACDRPKEAFMGGHPFPEIPCKLCSKPVDLTVDLSADENGRAVHADCYIKHITNSRSNPPASLMAD